MLIKKIPLDEYNKEIYMEAYIADKDEKFTRDAILIMPGGGYYSLSTQREGETIALSFISHGYNAFVLHYSVTDFDGKPFPAQLIEASKAVKHIKDNAEEYGINPKRVFACGFSAGGHLCATLGTLWHKKEVYDAIDMPYGYNKPTGVMLIYPVISAKHHGFSFVYLLHKKAPTEQELRSCSIEENVDENASPAFIMHTADDDVVDVKNSLCIANAYSDKKVPFELHIYPSGPHGIALANEITSGNLDVWNNPAIAKWVENAVYWAKSIE